MPFFLNLILGLSFFAGSFLLFPFCKPTVEKTEIGATIDSLMNVHYPEDQPGASLIVYQDHKLWFKGAYGLASIDSSENVGTETVFRIGSITKQFTAIGILMLLSEERLSLDDKVQDYYPQWFDNKEPITIRQLLSHTSGLKDLSQIRAVRPLMQVESTADHLVEIISREDLNFEPGSDYEYTNSGYVILGGILEKVSGLTYRVFLKTRIFDPLGMDNTYYSSRSEISSKTATGYFTRPDNYVLAPEIHSSLLFAAGGLWSNVSDMADWNEALYSDILVPQEYIQMAFSPSHLNNESTIDYGFGFRNCEVNGLASIEHGGGVFGYSSYGIRIAETGVYVLILSNFERNNKYDELAAEIAAMASNAPFHYTFKDPKIENYDYESLTGQYLSENGDTMKVEFSNYELAVKRGNSDFVKLKHIAHTSFLLDKTLDDKVIFQQFPKPGLVWKRRRSMGVEAIKI